MTHHSLSRKDILRRAAAYAARRARPARPDPLAQLVREIRKRGALMLLAGTTYLSWDAPIHQTPLADMRAVQAIMRQYSYPVAVWSSSSSSGS